jgi:cytochrome P450
MATSHGSPQGEYRGNVRRPHLRSLDSVCYNCTNNQDRALGRDGLHHHRSREYQCNSLLREGIFSQDGHAWKRSRDLIRRQFVRVQQQSLEVFTPPVNELVSTLSQAAAGGEIVDLMPFFYEFTLSTTTELLFGEPHSSMPKKDRDALRDNLDYATFGVGLRVRLADLAPLWNPSKFRKACKGVREWATFFADKAFKYKDEVGEETASEKYSFIMDLWKEMRDEGLVRDQLLHILMAGRDSTAALLSWTW